MTLELVHDQPIAAVDESEVTLDLDRSLWRFTEGAAALGAFFTEFGVGKPFSFGAALIGGLAVGSVSLFNQLQENRQPE